MIRLRKILLCNYPFYILLFLCLTITFIRIDVNYKSIYSSKTNHIIGTITDINIDGAKLTIKIDSKEDIIGTYYFSKKSEKDFFLNNIKLGDKLKIVGEFSRPIDNKTELLFNYKDYLKRQRIFYLVKIDKMYLINKNSNFFYYIKNMVIKRCSNSYIKTFILGDTDGLNNLDKYRDIGISHLFAISGMHISLLSMVLLKILNKLKVTENKRYLIVGIFLVFYLFLTGCSASVLRAVLFFILFSINKIFYFYIKNTNIFILTVFISLLINPFFIYEVSFQYSFLISFSLLLLGDFINKYSNYFIKLLITSFISFIVSIPITLYNFNQINILSIIYNLFYVPLISFIVFPLSIISFFIPVLTNILNIFIYILEITSKFFYKISFSKFIFCDIDIAFYYIYYLLIIIFFYGILNKKKYLMIGLFIMIIIHYLIPYFDKSDYIYMIDVGQGDSILIHSNNRNVLIDTGGIMNYYNKKWQKSSNPYSIVKNRTIPLFKKLGIKKIDYLILTHGDFDHLGETVNLINNFKVNKILINSGDINYLEKNIIKRFSNVERATKDYYFKIGDAEFLELNTDLGEENDSSLVFYTVINSYKILFMGDASIKSEVYIIDNYDLFDIDILKAGHHGSKTSSSEEFISSISPKLVLISAGLNNKFNHPNKEVISLLEDNNIKYLITFKEGSIKISL